MHTNIGFPNIGIELSNVGTGVTIFGYRIAFYGLVIGFGILLGILLAVWSAKKSDQNPEIYLDIALYGVIFGIVGARIYYVVFSWDDYKNNLLEILNIRGGGLAIYGGVIAAILTVFVYSRIKKLSFPLLCDTAITSLLLGQVAGRWGNFFNREAFGDYTNNLFAMRLPIDAVNKSNVTGKMLEHIQVIDGVEYIQVHPTFLYESVWNLILLGFLIWYRPKKKFDGEIILMYLSSYGFGRMLIEGLRTDQLILFGTGLPVSQVLAGALFVGATILILVFRKKSSIKAREN